jgi:hypothetical protein
VLLGSSPGGDRTFEGFTAQTIEAGNGIEIAARPGEAGVQDWLAETKPASHM